MPSVDGLVLLLGVVEVMRDVDAASRRRQPTAASWRGRRLRRRRVLVVVRLAS